MQSAATRPDLDEPTATGQPAGSTPLFLVHDETCSPEHVAALARHLCGPAALCPLSGWSGPQSGLRTVEGIALRLARRILAVQPAGPYRLAGWALGGILAYEVAGLLLGRDQSVEFLGWIHPAGQPPDATSAGAFGAGDEWVHRAARRYVPPPLPVAVHLFTGKEAHGAGPWQAWGTAEPKTALRTIRVEESAFPGGGPDPEALAAALAGEVRGAGGRKTAEPEERLSPVFPLRFKGSR
ncbi:MAG TPA: thioesterase domain-containing protein, partial [Longimicrobium sp.]